MYFRPIKVCNYVRELDEMHKDTNLILSDQYDVSIHLICFVDDE
jgi:hypothetical protein